MSDIHQRNLLVCLFCILYFLCLTSINKIYLYIYFVSLTFYVWLPSTKFNCVRTLHSQYFMSDIHQRNLLVYLFYSLFILCLTSINEIYLFNNLAMLIFYVCLPSTKFTCISILYLSHSMSDFHQRNLTV